MTMFCNQVGSTVSKNVENLCFQGFKTGNWLFLIKLKSESCLSSH